MRLISRLSIATLSLLPTLLGRHLPPSNPTSAVTAITTAPQASFTSNPTLAIPDVGPSWTHILGAAEHTIQDSVASNEESIAVEMEKQEVSSQKEAEVGDEFVSERDAEVEVKAEPNHAEGKGEERKCRFFHCEGWP